MVILCFLQIWKKKWSTVCWGECSEFPNYRWPLLCGLARIWARQWPPLLVNVIAIPSWDLPSSQIPYSWPAEERKASSSSFADPPVVRLWPVRIRAAFEELLFYEIIISNNISSQGKKEKTSLYCRKFLTPSLNFFFPVHAKTRLISGKSEALRHW